MQLDHKPVVTVLCAAGKPPPDLQRLGDRMTIRITDDDGLAADIRGADVVLLWDFFSSALRDAWSQADRVRWVHVAAAGVDRLLFNELVESPVTVTNARGVFDTPMAEFTLMCMLNHAKDTWTSHELQNRRQWDRRETTSLSGRTALIVGTGSIGRAIAGLLRAAGMQVQGAGRSSRDGDPDFGPVHSSAALRDYVGWADYVILATPLTRQTRGLMDAAVLRAMRPTAYLVNIGRGACVVENDLIQALARGQIAGAALDVFETEPLPPDHPLWTTRGVVITPHLSGDARGRLDVLARQFVDNAERYMDGRDLMNVVDKHLGFVPSGTPVAPP